ncbi:PREDICTED: leucine-rich repeat-containing G-protein coupled receptor 6 [Myotis brandtii]|uniref:leucine-rich repeat-containing G-protein coupled receptor 6 n=1 Tax=Myotis brandtii TaxID=109478 RepID=UPI000703EDF7|nr:PREDICTED: leucine-rich repeat-containing G-protein coupled receptor 6 [Myotis brandtii]
MTAGVHEAAPPLLLGNSVNFARGPLVGRSASSPALGLFPASSASSPRRDLSMNNLTELQPGRFHRLRFLEELRLSGNHLSHIPGGAFSGLHSLKILMLQNNQLGGIPAEALRQLPSLQSLRLDANLISLVPERSFEGLSCLRHLWLDDNALTEVPVRALNNLPALQAMTLALNRIRHVPDYAFQNLSSLVVLHLHNNRIQRLGTHSFEGLHSLETLDLNHNDLREFPVAIRTLGRLQELGFHNNNIKAIPEKAFMGNPLLQTIHFYDNPIQSVGRSAFQYLPKLHTLSLNGATDIQEFPDLKGTTSLETLELSHNGIEELPSLHRCQKLEEIGLQHNRIWEVRADTFRQLSSLRALDLSWNSIRSIHPEAFATLRSLVKLDLTDNQLTTLPLAGLGGLKHLKLKGNPALSQAFSKDSFPKLRILEVPYAYQCCAYGVCAGLFKASGQRGADVLHLEDEEPPKGPLGLLAGQAESHYDLDLEEMEDTKPHPRVQCSPVPGPFKPCEHLFESWGVRLAVWAIVLLSLLCNGLVLSCDSTQALVAFSDMDLVLEASEAGRPPGPETYGFLTGTLVSCPQPESPRPQGSHLVEPEGTHFGNQQPPMDRELLLRAEGAAPGGGGVAAGRGIQPSGSAFASHL